MIFIQINLAIILTGLAVRLLSSIGCSSIINNDSDFSCINNFASVLSYICGFTCLLLLHSFLIVPYVLYFIIGYIVSLKIYPIIDAPYHCRKGSLAYNLIFDIISFYPLIIFYLLCKKLQLKSFIKTPFSEYEKHQNKLDSRKDVLEERYKEKTKNRSSNSSCGGFYE